MTIIFRWVARLLLSAQLLYFQAKARGLAVPPLLPWHVFDAFEVESTPVCGLSLQDAHRK